MKFSWVLIFLSIIMCIVLIGVQVCRDYPIGLEIPEDPYLGEPLLTFHSLIDRGSVTLDVIGQYETHGAMIFKNGERYLLVEKFPITIEVMSGDVLEVWVIRELKGTSLIIRNTTDNIKLKYARTSIPLEKGLHRVAKVFVKD
ncbi:MAG: hypothetical protein GX283_00655 [Clostridiaceae bacterium]|jgi:hypothetical protein|nr:hypothetical protein [Clostridiaceae bacterium]